MTDTVIYADEGDYDLANRFVLRAVAAETISAAGSHYHIGVADSANATAQAAAGRPVAVNTTAAATEQIAFTQVETDGVAFPAVRATAGETVATHRKATIVVTDGAAAQENATPRMEIVVAQSAAAVAAASVVRAVTISTGGAAAAAETATSVRKSIVTVTETGAASSANGGAAHVLSAAVAGVATETVVRAVRARNTVAVSAAATEALKLRTTIIVKDHAVIASAMSAAGIFHLTVAEAADAEEYVRLPALDVPNLYVNTHSGAAAQWAGLPFDSMIEADGLLYAAGPDGLFSIANGINDSNDAAVEWAVTWDLDDFGSRRKKRIASVYVAAASAGPFTVRLATDEGHVDCETRLPRNAKATNHRAQAPRGLEAVYFRVGVRGSKDFGADHVVVDYENVARSIT